MLKNPVKFPRSLFRNIIKHRNNFCLLILICLGLLLIAYATADMYFSFTSSHSDVAHWVATKRLENLMMFVLMLVCILTLRARSEASLSGRRGEISIIEEDVKNIYAEIRTDIWK